MVKFVISINQDRGKLGKENAIAYFFIDLFVRLSLISLLLVRVERSLTLSPDFCLGAFLATACN
ncbi:MAG: hypothetical protein F6K22_11380 [Okeania sp. SIO2F4]|nr:hypothetical protein [Okeania sp. SIO2F4]